MLTFVLDYIREGIAMYSYMPEGDEDRVGHVGMVIETGERLFSELAPGDEHKGYAFHMMHRIDQFRVSGRFQNEGLVAWC